MLFRSSSFISCFSSEGVKIILGSLIRPQSNAIEPRSAPEGIKSIPHRTKHHAIGHVVVVAVRRYALCAIPTILGPGEASV